MPKFPKIDREVSSLNKLKLIAKIQDITLKYKNEGISQIFIFENYIYPVYFISLGTYYKYLSTPAKARIKAITSKQK